MKFKPLPPIDFLREHLNYDALTGAITWARQRDAGLQGRVRTVGGSACSLNKGSGYMRINLPPYGIFQAHRIAYAMGSGLGPQKEIDHIDRNTVNNAFSNLREATRQLNAFNRNAVGVARHPRRKRNPYQARIRIDGHDLSLGVFPTFAEACAAYACAKNAALVSAARQLGGEDQS